MQPRASSRTTKESEEISARLKQANSLRAKGRLEEAAKAYRSVIARDPDHVVALAALGNIATRLRDFDAALKYLHAASALDPKNHKWLMAIGDVLRQASRLEEARAIYEKIAAEDPSNERAATCLGLIARQNNDTAKARTASIPAREEPEEVEDIAARLKTANALRAKGRMEEASDAYRSVIALDPDHVVALAALGNIATRLRDFDAALKYLQAASALDPKNHKLLMAVGDALRQVSRVEEARAIYEKIAAEDPSNERAATCLGLIARQRDDAAKARTATIPAREEPEEVEDIAARLKTANALRAKGRMEEAADAYRSVIALDPDHVVALAALGNIATRLRDFDAALKYLQAASALDLKNHKLLMAVGDVLRQASRLEEARAIYEKIAAEDPSNERAATCLGLMARQSNDAAKAGTATIPVAEGTVPGNISALLKQANSLRAKGRMEEAADAYRGVIALDPDHVVALAALGHVATRLRNFDAALKYLQAASALDPKNHKLLMAIGDVLRQVSRLEEARSVYERIAAEDPANERAATCLGLIARQNHETAKAIFHFERALTIDPNGQIAKDMLAQLRSENVSRESAKNEHLRILEQDPQNSRSLIALARLARRDGEHEQAQKYLEAASLANPADLQLCAEHADELRELRRFDEAEAIYKSVLSTGGDNAKALTGLGFIARTRGDGDAAAGYFKAAAELKRKGNDDLTAGFAARIEDGNDLLRRLFPGLVAQATLPTLLDYNRAALLVAPCRGASSLVITFGGNTAQLALPSEITTLENTHVIAIRDPQRCFSLRGLPGLGETYWACLHNLRRLMTEFGATNLYCLGVSAGGYSALRYGLDLGADGVLVFSAPTTLDLADDDDAPLSRYPQLTALYRDLPDIRLDLAKLYEAKLPRPRAILVYSPSDKRDCWLADRMRGINGVKLDVAPKEAGHRVFSWLKAANRISPYIDRLLALRPVAGPRIEQE